MRSNVYMRLGAAACAALLASCSNAVRDAAPLPPDSAAFSHAAPSGAAEPIGRHKRRKENLTIRVRIPKARHHKRGRYISPATRGMKLSFTGTKSFTEAIALTQVSQGCSNSTGAVECTVTVALPTGTYAVSVATYDQAPSGGTFSSGAKLLSTASNLPLTVKLGKPNTLKVTLDGVPAALAVSGIPSGSAGMAFSALGFTVAVNDAGGYTIVGTYDSPVTLSDSDKSGATSIATSGSDKPAAGKLLSSNDNATLSYSGLALAPVTIGASVTGATNASAQFAPTLQPIVFTAQGGSTTQTINLYADANDPDSAGLSASFTATEAGWTNAPYNRNITATPADACNAFSNTSPASGTSFTTTASLIPTTGLCTLTLSDGNGQTLHISLSYAVSSTTINTAGSTQFTVPDGVTRITVTAGGAQGGTGYNGLSGGEGGSVTGTIAVTPGQTFDVVVGGKGGNGGTPAGGSAGTNGGGAGSGSGEWGGGGGGGESTFALSGTRLFVAGGGGGSAGASSDFGGTPGGGGGTSGQVGGAGDGGGGGGGGGGATQSLGGTGGTGLAPGGTGGTGTANTGGAAGLGSGTGPNSPGAYAPGGGGAGHFGGGGGGTGAASSDNTGGSGGGGSSFAAGSILNVTYTTATQSGDGVVIIAY
ncbi:MAG TPA: hypothetical protein VGG89_07750 [Candidatus Baltobacteraceae bacterium]|jgi:hypothetical protein